MGSQLPCLTALDTKSILGIAVMMSFRAVFSVPSPPEDWTWANLFHLPIMSLRWVLVTTLQLREVKIKR